MSDDDRDGQTSKPGNVLWPEAGERLNAAIRTAIQVCSEAWPRDHPRSQPYSILAEALDDGFNRIIRATRSVGTVNGPAIGSFANAVAESPEGRDGVLSGFRLLYADGNDLTRRITKGFVEKYGVDAQVAADSVEALALAESQRFDAAIVDSEIPDAVALVEGLRRIESFDATTLYAIGSADEPEARNRLREAGADDVIDRPVDPARVLEALHRTAELRDDVPFDFSKALGRFGGKKELLAQALSQLSCEIHEHIATLLAEKRNWKAVNSIAHALKGTAGILGAHSVLRLASSLNDAVKAEDWELAVRFTASFTGELERLNEFIKLSMGRLASHAAEPPAPTPEKGPPSERDAQEPRDASDDPRELALRLLDALGAGDIESEAIHERGRHAWSRFADPTRIAMLTKYIRNFDYGSAAAIVGQLLASFDDAEGPDRDADARSGSAGVRAPKGPRP